MMALDKPSKQVGHQSHGLDPPSDARITWGVAAGPQPRRKYRPGRAASPANPVGKPFVPAADRCSTGPGVPQ
jgi:hypothetical protein